MKKIFIILYLIIIFIGFQCSSTEEKANIVTNKKIEFYYGDGNGNRYHLYKTNDEKGEKYHLDFSPIKDVFSSSKEYSGGDPFSIIINEDDYIEIYNALEAGIVKEDFHQKNREMMTGIILRIDKNHKKMVILKSYAPIKMQIETLLKSFHPEKVN